MKKMLCGALALMGVMTLCEAQVTFSEGFEGYAEGKVFSDLDFPWYFSGWGPGTKYPFVVGNKYGVSPVSGSKALEIRSNPKGGVNAMGRAAPDPDVSIPVTSVVCSMSFLVPSVEFSQQQVFFQLGDKFFVRNIRVDVGSKKVVSSFGSGTADVPSLTADKWFEAKWIYSINEKKFQFFLDGKVILEDNLAPNVTGRGTTTLFGTNNPTDLSNNYPMDVGSPGALFDQVSFATVPEPATATALLLAGGMGAMRRRRRQ